MKLWISGLVIAVLTIPALADSVSVTMYATADTQQKTSLGTITLVDTSSGLLIEPNLQGLTPGIHGFHVHQNPNCADNGMAAGGHLDPKASNKHLGPYSLSGHLGDLPALTVGDKGMAKLPVLAPHLKVADVLNHSLVIHLGGDNYSDTPEKLGGGGARLVCGVVPVTPQVVHK